MWSDKLTDGKKELLYNSHTQQQPYFFFGTGGQVRKEEKKYGESLT